MDAVNLHKKAPQPAGEEVGVLVLQTGRQAGARRPLGMLTTFVGRGPRCDIRLNVDGVDALHCLLVSGKDGVQLRDLDSTRGTFVNGTRTEQALLRDGDLLEIGPFQFRVELAPRANDRASEEMREALRVQAAAIAAQQAALEEEEMRLEQRRSDLKQQEEQLAAHLDEKQRQVQLWADYTKAERDTLRKEKAEQEKLFAKLEDQIAQANDELAKERQQASQARQRIEKVYQRLRQRWQRQWGGARQKHERQTAELAAQRAVLQERERDLAQREAVLAEDIAGLSSEREQMLRGLREARDQLKHEHESWRRRRSQEHLVLKARARELDQTQNKVKQLRELLVEEKDLWDKQQDSLQKELHGLNNRIVHLRARVQEQQEELVRLDAAVRERRGAQAAAEGAPAESTGDSLVEPAGPDASVRRSIDLDRLAGELADQRLNLIEQYKRLAEIQDAWQQQRDAASADLEALARRLIDEEEALAERERNANSTEELLGARARELDALGQEITFREQTLQEQHQKETGDLRQHQKLLEEQLAGLAVLRKRWNLRRQKEIEHLQAERVMLAQEQQETQDRRLVIFDKGQQVDEEKRMLAEKALALEQYRQDVFIRAKDPMAQRRVERLRRRWLTLNSALIRNAKTAAEVTKKQMAELEGMREELAKLSGRLTQEEAALADKITALEERETATKIRQQQLDLRLRELAQHDVETIAHGIYREPETPPLDQAA